MKRITLTFLSALTLSLSINAGNTAKPGARWWWLGSALDTTNVRWNMEQYASHGIGALEITPLYGVQGNEKNNIDYLSPKWMNILKFVEKEGKRLGIQIDMNNGTGWPFGGPTTPLEEAACKVVIVDSIVNSDILRKGYTIIVPEKEKKYSSLSFIMAFPCNVKGYKGQAIEITPSVNTDGTIVWKAPKKGAWRIIALYNGRTRQQVKRAAPGGAGYVIDHFDKNAVKNYLEKFDKAFSESNTPWPNTIFNDSYEVYGADWSPTLPQEFETRRGYSLKDNINKLVDRDEKIVCDYRETLNDMLRENFTNQWVKWAHSHGMLVRNQAHGSPANLLDLYAAVDIPEIEGFGLSEFGIKGLRVDPGMTKLNDSDYSMFKYAPSAAHVTGKNLVSSETFTWLTEHFRTSLSQMKPDLDLMFCAGVNHMYYHGTCYSPKDDPWPGWKFYASIDMSPTNSIWRDAPYFNKYVERCQGYLQKGEPYNEILVYFPIHNLWKKNQKTLLQQFAIHNLGHLAPEFKASILELDKLGYDCDYISDLQILASKAANKNIITEAGIAYKALLIPEGAILTDEVKTHIDALKSQGVTIINGNDANALAKVTKPEEMKTKLGLNMIRRKTPKGTTYFIANLTPKDVDAYVKIAVDYKELVWLDPVNEKMYSAETTAEGVRVNMRSGESMILLASTSSMDAIKQELNLNNISPRPTSEVPGSSIEINKGWCLSFTNEAPEVKGSFNIDKLQTWETLDDDSAKVTMGTGVYETTFNIQNTQNIKKAKGVSKNIKPTPLTGTWNIDLGDVRESARVYINNTFIGCAWSVPYVLPFNGDILKTGENSIRIEVTNLPANRIADLDRKGVEWRKMEEINVVDIKYKKTKYDGWAPVPSGLNSSVRIYEVK
ncbi:MAG: glycosyl hydrolase family 2 [Prevotella sp.]|nr:glycosyl hydrolase family 2 [Candidatus Prevotella equi]